MFFTKGGLYRSGRSALTAEMTSRTLNFERIGALENEIAALQVFNHRPVEDYLGGAGTQRGDLIGWNPD